MPSPYQSLIDRYGEEGAKAEMARRAKLVKNKRGGFATMSKEKHLRASSDGGMSRAENYQDTEGEEATKDESPVEGKETDSQ